ncbi:hypothetical protein Ae201684P_014311 [Aphanomyces euteiches]|uniref:CBM1 domain-containing protein n=1 Tax=Aphanomyces euteiches TaxID=100861 RepID=A0A6G0WYP8_9STRA|nr:hypothetical protein Ae201684_010349 [Aphanomyces euteiches]KAH9090510.1 hypothetical protein Ae201684P_014311 [Aphanomyces euteiches]KAH9143127.1 hypothetical protein AeRB84_012849 [Aphanomyces euteiches]
MQIAMLASLTAVVFGHGQLLDPKPTYLNQYGDTTTFCGVIDGPTTFPGENYDLGPSSNTQAFTRQFDKSGFASLKAFFDSRETGGECGITKADGSPQALPIDGVLKWGIGGSEGFVSSHEGPCEVWCDSTRAFHNDNCAKNMPNGHIPIDMTVCQGAKKLVVLWLALHAPTWQVYKNCVRLSGGETSTPSSSTPSMVPVTTSPASTQSSSEYPSASTATPSSTTSNSDQLALGWRQCGGSIGYNGPTNCIRGFHCVGFSAHYSQCMPNEPPQGQLQTYLQCGGRGYSGLTQCKDGDSCVVVNEWYSQCLPGSL